MSFTLIYDQNIDRCCLICLPSNKHGANIASRHLKLKSKDYNTVFVKCKIYTEAMDFPIPGTSRRG